MTCFRELDSAVESGMKSFAKFRRSGWIPRLILIVSLSVPLACIWSFIADIWEKVFWTIFTFRYTRTYVHLGAYWAYRPAPIQAEPKYTSKDVTVVMPTIDPKNAAFDWCVRSILKQQPKRFLVVTTNKKRKDCLAALQPLMTAAGTTEIMVSALPKANKRVQTAHAMALVETEITVWVDDHVRWITDRFLDELLAPFERDEVVGVASHKTVVRTSWSDIWNFIASLYLQRHNFELQGSVDGGHFVLSGRTVAWRTGFVKAGDRLKRFCEETIFGELLIADDDNWWTREALKAGMEIFFQATAKIETTLGEFPKIIQQFLRWSRTTERSNPLMLISLTFLWTYTWSYFMVYFVGISNFALFWDFALIATLHQAKDLWTYGIYVLVVWMLLVKSIKIIPHLILHPSDILLLPVQFLFGYFHSCIKLYALLTWWVCKWSGRDLDDAGESSSDTNATPVDSEWIQVQAVAAEPTQVS